MPQPLLASEWIHLVDPLLELKTKNGPSFETSSQQILCFHLLCLKLLFLTGQHSSGHQALRPDPRRHRHRDVHFRLDRNSQGRRPDPQEPGGHHEVSDVHAQPEGGRHLHRLPAAGPRPGADEREHHDALWNQGKDGVITFCRVAEIPCTTCYSLSLPSKSQTEEITHACSWTF